MADFPTTVSQIGMYTLSPEHGDLVKSAYDKMGEAKRQLADLEVEYYNQKSALLAHIGSMSSLYSQLISSIAKTVGITDHGGTWDFDVNTMKFTRRTPTT